MRNLFYAAVSAAAVLACSSAFAAELGGVRGKVLVDTGKGFRPAAASTQLKAGDRVMVASKSAAMLSYNDKCRIPLGADSMTVVAQTGCVMGTQDSNGQDPAGNAAGSNGGGTGLGGLFRTIGPGLMIGPAVTVIAAQGLSGNDDEDDQTQFFPPPVSP